MTQRLPLVLLPGLTNDERLWQHQRAALEADREVVVVTTFGHDNVEALAQEALARAPSGRFALAGFSLGGYVSLAVLRQAAGRVAGIAFVDTSARPDTAESTAMRRQMVAALRKGTAEYDTVAGAFLARLLHPAHASDAELQSLLLSMARSVGTDGFVRQQTAAMNRPDSRGQLAQIAVPAVVVCGEQDQVTPPALSEELAAGIPGSELVMVKDSGHMAPLEQPAAVTAAMRAWLARIDG